MRILPDLGNFCLIEEPRVSASVSVGLTGLNESYAEIGNTISYASSLGQAPDGGVKWAGASNPDEPAIYGTGDSPLDFVAGDGAVLYLHLFHGGSVYTRFAPIRQPVAPTVVNAPTVEGDAREGLVLTGTAAVFDGPAITVNHVWEESSDGLAGWSNVGADGLTSPSLVLNRYYRLVAQATNTRGVAQAVSDSIGPVSAAPSVTIQNVVVGSVVDQVVTVNISATGAQDGDDIVWSLAPETGGAPVAENSATPLVWPGDTVELPGGIENSRYIMTVTVGASAPFATAPFDVDTVSPVLSLPLAEAANGTLTWSVTSSEARGTIYAALRLATDSSGSAQQIIDGTGYLGWSQDVTPTIDGSNGGTFSGLVAGEYVVDMVQRDALDNASNIVGAGATLASFPSNTITIAAQPEMMPGFPVAIDLSRLGPDVWAALRADGGNLRAVSSDGTTDFPLDITHIDTVGETGRAFVRQDLSDSEATFFKLEARENFLTAAADTDPVGRNAVWAGYLAVMSFPETLNRTGGIAPTLVDFQTGLSTNEATQSTARQGIAYGGTARFAFDTEAIHKYATNWVTQSAANMTPFAGTGLPGAANHIGDGCFVADELFVAVGDYPNQQENFIVVYDAGDLSYVRKYDMVASGILSASSVCYNADDDLFYVTDYDNDTLIYVFDSTFVAQTPITLSVPVTDMQGITYLNGMIYVSSNTSGADCIRQISRDGTVLENQLFCTSQYSQGMDTDDGDLISVATGFIVRTEVAPSPYLMSGNTTTAFVEGIAAQDQWTLSASASPRFVAGNDQIVGVNNSANLAGDRTGIFVRSTGNFQSWASGSGGGWLSPSPAVAHDTNEHRLALTFDGSTERQLFLDGALYASDTGMAAKYSSGTMQLSIAQNGAGADRFDGFVGDVFFHSTVRSAAWLAAEHDTLNHVASFAIIT